MIWKCPSVSIPSTCPRRDERSPSTAPTQSSGTVTLNAYPDESFTGRIVTTDARLSETNRMVMVRAEIANADMKLVPGMYANVLVDVGAPETVVTVPQTAVTYSLYGDNIFVVNTTRVKDKDGKVLKSMLLGKKSFKKPARDETRTQPSAAGRAYLARQRTKRPIGWA